MKPTITPMSNTDHNYIGVLLEHTREQNKGVLEAVSDLRAKVEDLPTRDEFAELQQGVKTIKAAVTATNHEVRAVGSQLKLPQIAEGLADAYPRLNNTLHLWDIAAGHAILVGAAGSVQRPDGSPIDYHSPNLLVGDFVAKS